MMYEEYQGWSQPIPKDLMIILPDERRVQLTTKLAEYKRRLRKDREIRLDSIHKIYVLEELLTNGRISPGEMSARATKDLGRKFDPELFDRAWKVMKDYCETGGNKLSGGTGLPQI